MLLVSMFQWWYSAGIVKQIDGVKSWLLKINDQFSIPLLLKTMFQPFRQISANESGLALEDKLRAWLDKLVSRLIGAFIRFFVMIAGIIVMIFAVIFSGLRLIAWLILPILPVLGVVLMTTVGLPWI